MCVEAKVGPFIRTRRLELREFRAGDESDLVDLHRDPRVCEFLVDDPVRTEAEAATVIRWLVGRVYPAKTGLGLWHASVREDGAFAGFFSLTAVANSDDVELGARLHPRVWGRRLALEGADALIRHAFGTLGLGRLIGISHAGNRPVRFFLERLGFVPVEAVPETDGRVVRYVLARDRWENRTRVAVPPDTTTPGWAGDSDRPVAPGASSRPGARETPNCASTG